MLLQLTVAHLCCWGPDSYRDRIPTVRLAVALKIINAAKLLQMIRITNVDGRYSSAPIAQMRMLAVVLICNRVFHL